MPGLPLGRGYRTGSNATVNQNESFAIRRALAADQRGWILSPLSSPVANRLEQGNVTKSEARFLYLGQIDASYTIAESRIVAGTGDSGCTLTAALYTFDEGDQVIRKITASEATFDLTSAAQVAFSYGTPFTLPAKARLFLGTVASGGAGTPQVNSIAINGAFSCRTLSGTIIPSGLKLQDLSTATGYVPGVSFLDVRAKDLF